MKWIAMCAATVLTTSSWMALAQQAGDEYDVIFADAPQTSRAERGVIIGVEKYLEHSIAVGAFGTILTRQGNESWQQQQVPTSVLLTSAYYVDANTIWVSGHDGVLLVSEDAGQSWTRSLDGYELLDKELAWLEEREAFLTDAIENAEDDDDASEYEFLLDELSFQVQATEVQQDVGPTKPLFDVYFSDHERGFAVGAYGLLLETLNGGSDWTVVSERLDNPTAYHLNKIIAAEDGSIFVIAEAGQLFRSEDNGQTFETLDSPYHGSLFGGLFDQQGRLWIYGLRGNVFVSSDNGDSFESVDGGTRYNLNSGTVMADGTIVLAGHSGTLLFIDPRTLVAERFEHSSNVPLSGVLQDTGNELILAGRGGLLQFMYPASAR